MEHYKLRYIFVVSEVLTPLVFHVAFSAKAAVRDREAIWQSCSA